MADPGDDPRPRPTRPPSPQPVCPACGARGLEHIISRDSTERARNRRPWFQVVFCAPCGHVYGVLAKHVFSEGAEPRFVLPGAPTG